MINFLFLIPIKLSRKIIRKLFFIIEICIDLFFNIMWIVDYFYLRNKKKF